MIPPSHRLQISSKNNDVRPDLGKEERFSFKITVSDDKKTQKIDKNYIYIMKRRDNHQLCS